jgi:hypothetical protein
MTELLEKAFTKASKLPKEEQERLAVWILEEIAVELYSEVEPRIPGLHAEKGKVWMSDDFDEPLPN